MLHQVYLLYSDLIDKETEAQKWLAQLPKVAHPPNQSNEAHIYLRIL